MSNVCCIVGCGSRRKDVNLYRLPRREILLNKWLQCIKCERLRSLKREVLRNQHVCQKHFEKRFIANTVLRPRISGGAYPTLFTESEIESGIPITKYSDLKSNHNDNSCSSKGRHNDHTYYKIKAVEKSISFNTGGLQRHAMSASNKDNLEPDDEADNISGTDDDPLPESHADESNVITEEPIVPEKAYSWEKKKDAVPIQADIVEDDEDNLSMYCDDGASPPHYKELQDDPTLHQGYHCNVCNGEIRGFRYTCVQCNDFDLCSACETNKAHHHHYVLRVPEPRPYVEIQSILGRIRRHLMQKMDPIGDPDQDVDDVVSIKSEVKSEDEDEEPMKETTKEVPDSEIQQEAAQLENVANEVELDTVEIDNSVTSKHSVVHIKEIPTPSEPKAVSREKQWTPTPGQRKLLVKLEDFMNMPNAKRICLMRVPSTQSEKRQDGCHTSQNKPQSTDSKLHPPEPPDPLHITQNASTKLSLSVYKRRFPLDDR